MLVKIISPDKTLFQSEAQELLLQTEDGEIGIMDHHEALISVLKEGSIKVRQGDVWKELQGSKGLLEVQKNQVLILLDS